MGTRSAFLIVMPPDSSRLYRPNPPCRGLHGGFGCEENIMKKQRKSVYPMVTCTCTVVPAAASGSTLPARALPSTVMLCTPCCTAAVLSTAM